MAIAPDPIRACLIAGLCGVAALAGAQPAAAAAGAWWTSDHAQVRLIAASDTAGDSRRLALGLEFKLVPGWKIYWRSPGDAGYPPRPNWAGSRNVMSVAIRWPAPQRFSVLGFETLGYKEEIVLPLEVTPFEPGKPTTLRATVPFLTCDDICVPYEAQVALDLPAGPETTTREAARIAAFAAAVPQEADAALRIESVFVDGAPGDQALRVAVRSATAIGRPDVFVEGPAGFRFAAPQMAVGETHGATLTVFATPPPNLQGAAADLAGKTLTFTLVDRTRAVEQTVLAARGRSFAPRPAQPFDWSELLAVLAFAVLGGLILNLMPCVLPVLSLKLMSVVDHAGSAARDVRRGFLASAAGILTSFLVLATIAVALRSAGLAAGWGIQFQQPVFLVAMAVLLVLFAANLWGAFEFRLPGSLADRAATAGEGGGLAGHFATGAFATLLATPCSAPFLGTAVGFALARGPVEIYAVFAALGLGLAAPYLLVAAAPRLATGLPRPGSWMVLVRRVLGLALAATAGWLVAVLAAQAGPAAALATGSALLLIAALFVARRLWPQLPAALAWAGVLALSVASLAAPLVWPGDGGARLAGQADAIRWVRFEPEAIAGHISAGRIVFVDVTAEWCLTCQVNKRLVLEKDPIRARLDAPPVVAMRADWTRPDPVIAAFLRRYARFGIPFNVVYGPGTPGGRVLPELLTRDQVAAALDAAAGRPEGAGGVAAAPR